MKHAELAMWNYVHDGTVFRDCHMVFMFNKRTVLSIHLGQRARARHTRSPFHFVMPHTQYCTVKLGPSKYGASVSKPHTSELSCDFSI